MPDLPQLLLLVVFAALVSLAIAVPWLRRGSSVAAAPDEREVLALRHRIAIDSLRDVEADRRAGSLDDAAYAAQRDEAEAHAARTLAELEGGTTVAAPVARPSQRRAALAVAVAIAGALLVGFFLPAPVGLANPVVDTRQQAIDSAIAALRANPRDTQALSALADVLVAGDSYADMQRAAAALIALISLEPNNLSAYNRLVTTYIRVADWKDAAAATDSLAELAPNSPDVPFFRGLIARGSGDAAEARKQFARFLVIAPDDPRVTMVRALLDGS